MTTPLDTEPTIALVDEHARTFVDCGRDPDLAIEHGVPARVAYLMIDSELATRGDR